MKKISRQIKSFQLSPGQATVKQITFIIIVALLFIGLIILTGWIVNNQIQQTRQSVSLSSLLEKENIKLAMPVGFPESFPLVEPDKVSQAYVRDQQTKDITIAVESKKPVKENYDYYLDYGKDNNWQIDEAREATDKSPGKLLLRKDKLILSFSFKDKETGGSEIIISSTIFNLPRFLGPPLPANENEGKIPETGAGLTNPFLNQLKSKEEKIPAKVGQLPAGFPENFPLNGKKQITESWTLKTENRAGVTYVVRFKSSKIAKTNLDFYEDWFKTNQWTIGKIEGIKKDLPGDIPSISASLPFRVAAEISIPWYQTEADDFELPDAMSEVEVRWREFR